MNDQQQLTALRKKAERILRSVQKSNDLEQRILGLAIFDDVMHEAEALAHRIIHGQSGTSHGEGSQDAR